MWVRFKRLSPLPVAFDVIEAWGFEYRSCFVWVKPQMGDGTFWRVSHEFLLFGVRGSCPFENTSVKSWLELPGTEHSSKPNEVRQLIELVSPGPYLELYAQQRPTKPCWTAYGNDVSRKERLNCD